MKVSVTDYIANFLVQNGVTNLFSVVGGGAMFLNDAFGHKDGLNVTYHHHEQAAAIAAEGYARMKNIPAAVCVTSGPGCTNALTGCLCAYTGSIPVLFFSGQVRYSTTVQSTGLNLRFMGFQEFDIVNSVRNMTKYAELIVDANQIRYCLERALFLATHGRPGPVWLDIPLDIQNTYVESESLKPYKPSENDYAHIPEISEITIKNIFEQLKVSKRPLLLAGKGIRSANTVDLFNDLVHQTKIPVVNGMSSVDIIHNNNPYYVGRSGMTGDRAGNFAVQNCDLLISIGNRLSYAQIGFNTETWARAAYKIVIDIDDEELKKPYLNINMPVHGDAHEFISKLLRFLVEHQVSYARNEWLEKCADWKEKYHNISIRLKNNNGINIYTFYEVLSDQLNSDDVIVVSAGSARVVGSQTFKLKQGQRFITNSSTATMGYDLPTAIGVCLANDRKQVYLITGDGSIQMNIQELQTIKQNNLPIKIFVLNNDGYQTVRVTQQNYFKNKSYVGVGQASGDLSFPDFSKIASAYEYAFKKCDCENDLVNTLKWAIEYEGYCMVEVVLDTKQKVEPKVSSKKLSDGRFISAPLEDMAPFLSYDELKQNMYIPLIDEE